MPLPNWLLCALSFAAFSVIKNDSARVESAEQASLDEQERTQAAVLERAAQCDSAALGALYDQYADKIYNYIYHRVGQAELAEDLTGQVFMRMIEAIQTGQVWRTSFSGWLYRIAHNLVIDHYRRRQRATLVELDDAEPVQAGQGDPVAETELALDRQRLRSALSSLTEEQAQVITLRFLQELSIAEVADVMDKTEGAIKALQYRAVLALRRVMAP
jgi:RNA polymerase sigma-70 factor, ECF subfamily